MKDSFWSLIWQHNLPIYLHLQLFSSRYGEATKGGSVKGRFWQICPRSGFGGPGISKIIAFFCQNSTAEKVVFWWKLRYRGISAKTTFLETGLSCKPPTLDSWGWLRNPAKSLSGPVLRDAARLSQRYPPSLRAMGLLASQHGQLGAIPPPPF